MARTMAPKKDAPTNRRLKDLRTKSGLTQTEFGAKYFRVNLRTYQRYESTASHKALPGPVQVLIEALEAQIQISPRLGKIENST